MANQKPITINEIYFETIRLAAEFYKIPIGTVNTRLRKGWTIQQALEAVAPPLNNNLKAYNTWLRKRQTDKKMCRECKEEKALDKFYTLRGKTPSSICKECAPFYNRRKDYGITREEWNKLFTDQGKRCAICGSSDSRTKERGWHTDHDHITNKVRGVLCRPCNQLLGQAEDNIEVLQSAIEYLNRTK
jgi:hypothetical protein